MENDIRHWIEEFIEQRRARGYSEETTRGDHKRFRHFLLFLNRSRIHNVSGLTREVIWDYVLFVRAYRTQKGEPLSAVSLGHAFICVKLFLLFLAQKRAILYNPGSELPPGRRDKTIPKHVLTPIQAERVLALPDIETPKGLRDRALLELLYSTGIRRRELANLMLEDVAVGTGMVYIRQGKGRKDRMVPAGERALSWVKKYIAESRPQLLAFGKAAEVSKDHGYLFFNYFGQKMSVSKLTNLAGSYNRRAGIEKGACHIFRHTAATQMLENGADIRYIQEFLGHAEITTTQVYTKVSGKHLRETFKKSHPSAWAEEPDVKAVRTIRRTKYINMKPQAEPIRIPAVDVSLSPMHAALAGFRDAYAVKWSRSHTAHTVDNLLHFAGWCVKRRLTSSARITTDILEEYQKELTQTKERRTGRTISINNQTYRMRSVRDFFKWLFQEGKILIDPGAAVVLPRKSRYLPPEPLTLEEADRLLCLPDVTRPYGIRDRAMMEVLFATGMRREELVRLRLDDLDFERSMIRIKAAKTGDERNLPAGDRCFRWLTKYIEEVRPRLVLSDDPGTVFVASHGWTMDIGLPHVLMRRYFRLAGLKKRSLLHVFRHTAATLMLENGADIRAVQEFLGHRSIKSTQRYTQVSMRKLKQVHAETHPAEMKYLERLRSTDKEKEEAGSAPHSADALKPQAIEGVAQRHAQEESGKTGGSAA